VLQALENKHQDELEDLLKKLYEQRARELRDQIIALLEEKVQGRGVVDKDFQVKKDALGALIDGVVKEAGGHVEESVEKQNQRQSEELGIDHDRELRELEKDYEKKKGETERKLQAQALDRENKEVLALQEKQLAEKRRIMSERLFDTRVKDLLDELDEQEAAQLEEFKNEQDRRREEKLALMQAEALEMEKMLEEEMQKLEELKQNVGALSREQSPQATPTSKTVVGPRGLSFGGDKGN